MMNENSFIYRFLSTSWVLITVVSRNSSVIGEIRAYLGSPHSQKVTFDNAC